MGRSNLLDRTVAIVGLGYVGLPLAAVFLEKGYKVIGIDIDQSKLALIRQGHSYISDVPAELIRWALSEKRLMVSADYGSIKTAEAILICVPTPLNGEHIPDLSFLSSSAREIGQHLQPGQLVILESSTYPGTTREILRPILEQSGLVTGKDVFIGFSPERVDPGNEQYPLPSIPKVVSGITSECVARTAGLYQHVFRKVIQVSSTETAEMTKLLENTFRFVNISFINEFAMLCDRLGINVWEVLRAASSKPFGYTPFSPGPGIGGHCIPVDPLYLQWKARQYGLTSSFIELSSIINRKMPVYIVERLKAVMGIEDLKGVKLLVLGVTFKENVADIRESSALELIRLLLQEGADVKYYDPFIPQLELEGLVLSSSDDLKQSDLENVACAIIATSHRQLPIKDIVTHSKLVFDTRNATAGVTGNAKIVLLGGGIS